MWLLGSLRKNFIYNLFQSLIKLRNGNLFYLTLNFNMHSKVEDQSINNVKRIHMQFDAIDTLILNLRVLL